MDPNNDVVLASAAKSAAYTVVIQGTFRILTFAMNSVLLHHITRDMLGVANVRLMLLNQTILFLTCEAFRRACVSRTADRCWPQIINLLWFTIPLGLIWSFIFGFVWLYVWTQPDPSIVPYYDKAVVLYCVATFIEIMSQPLAVIGQILLLVEVKAVIEGLTLVLRCLITVGLVVFFPDVGLLSFCAAQCLYATLLLTLYVAYFVRGMSRSWHKKDDFPFQTLTDFCPRFLAGKPFLCEDLSRLVRSFFFQSVLKHFLTEGEKIVMTVLGVVSFADQGVYEVISNLGSLPARMLFLPVEDSVYMFFTKTLSRGKLAVNQQQDSMRLACSVLESTLKVCVLIGLVFVTFGFSYSLLLLRLYGGAVLSEGTGPTLLRWYCSYILLAAMNGVTEGFKNATMSDSQVNRFSRLMIVFTVVSILTSWLFTLWYGSVGLIWSNCINMALRTAHSVNYIKHFCQDSSHKPHLALFPCWQVLLCFGLCGCLMAISETSLCCTYGLVQTSLHVAVGCVCLVAVALSVFTFDKRLVYAVQNELYPLLRHRQPVRSVKQS